MAKVLMIVAKQDFRDEEFKEPFEAFMDKNITIRVASTEAGRCMGAYGMVIRADYGFSDFQKTEENDRYDEDKDIDTYSAMMIVGGFGAKEMEDMEELKELIDSFEKKGKIVSAICYSPVILAKTDLMKGKKATVWNEDGNQEPILSEHGVKYVNEDVVIDGKFITGRDYNVATKFGETLANAIIESENK